ncbi:uncharacterized protein LOC144578548 [Callithrix jacchus]
MPKPRAGDTVWRPEDPHVDPAPDADLDPTQPDPEPNPTPDPRPPTRPGPGSRVTAARSDPRATYSLPPIRHGRPRPRTKRDRSPARWPRARVPGPRRSCRGFFGASGVGPRRPLSANLRRMPGDRAHLRLRCVETGRSLGRGRRAVGGRGLARGWGFAWGGARGRGCQPGPVRPGGWSSR